MKSINLIFCGGICILLSACATTTPPAESPQMLVKENAGLVENSAENFAKPPILVPEPAEEKVATKVGAVNGESMNCSVKGKPVLLDDREVGITIQQSYCSANLKPEGSKIWIPETEAPMLGNISVDDACNITYCPTTPHYDHFGISDGNNTIQVQVKWQGSQPEIY